MNKVQPDPDELADLIVDAKAVYPRHPIFAESAWEVSRSLGVDKETAARILEHRYYLSRLETASTAEEYREIFFYIMRALDPRRAK